MLGRLLNERFVEHRTAILQHVRTLERDFVTRGPILIFLQWVVCSFARGETCCHLKLI